jgi:hypothetical protein
MDRARIALLRELVETWHSLLLNPLKAGGTI